MAPISPKPDRRGVHDRLEADRERNTGPDEQVEERAPDQLSELPKRSWLGVLRGTPKEFKDDELADRAAALTCYGVLALFPALLVLVSLLGIASESATKQVLDKSTTARTTPPTSQREPSSGWRRPQWCGPHHSCGCAVWDKAQLACGCPAGYRVAAPLTAACTSKRRIRSWRLASSPRATADGAAPPPQCGWQPSCSHQGVSVPSSTRKAR